MPAGSIPGCTRLAVGIRDDLVWQWQSVRTDPVLARLVAHLLIDPEPQVEPLVEVRLLELLDGLPLKQGAQLTAARLAAALLGQLGAASATHDKASLAGHRRTHNKLDALSQQLGAMGAATPEPMQQLRRVRFKLPLRAAAFTRRRRELEQLDQALESAELAVLAQAISGPGGVGRTQIAARYAHEHADRYDVVAWIAAEDGGVADLSDLADELGIDVAQLTPAERAARALVWLATCDERWLLVLDNLTDAEQLDGCCPSAGHGRVIITTRDRSMAQDADALTVEVFERQTARAGRDQRRFVPCSRSTGCARRSA